MVKFSKFPKKQNQPEFLFVDAYNTGHGNQLWHDCIGEKWTMRLLLIVNWWQHGPLECITSISNKLFKLKIHTRTCIVMLCYLNEKWRQWHCDVRLWTLARVCCCSRQICIIRLDVTMRNVQLELFRSFIVIVDVHFCNRQSVSGQV